MSSNIKCHLCQSINPKGSRFCNNCGNDLTTSLTPDGLLPPGTLLRGTYVIEEVIGEGGMGVVYSCHHKSLGTKYALKVLDAKLARMDILRQRFLSEAKIQAKVVHPHIVHVMDVLDSDNDGGIPGILAIVMEYVKGQSLDLIIEKKPLSERDAVSSTLAILDAIGFAHHEGIVHRDLKPSNIMVSSEEAAENLYSGIKVMDFGIAKLLEENEQRTVTGAKMGTPKYMAPEQIENARDVDERTDLYAIGLTLYEMLCGRTPFEEYREFELLKAQLTIKPPSMRTWRPDISDKLEAIVMKALEKEREFRYPNAESFQRALLSLGGYDDVPLRLNPYDGTISALANSKLQKKIERALDKSKRNSELNASVSKRRSSTNVLKLSSNSHTSIPTATKSKGENGNPPERSNETAAYEETLSVESSPNILTSALKKIKTHSNRSIFNLSKDKKKNGESSNVSFKKGLSSQNISKIRSNKKLQSKQNNPSIEKNINPENIKPDKVDINKSENIKETPKRSTPKSQPVQSPKTASSSKEGLSKQPDQTPVRKHPNTARNLVIFSIFALIIAGIAYRSVNKLPSPATTITDQTADQEQIPVIEDVSTLSVQEIVTDTGKMTHIPAARHWITTAKKNELHQMDLPAFDIDQVEVSYYQYSKCMEAGKCPPIANIPSDINMPVTNVGYGTAEAFCKFANKSLPTIQQWEAAARFGDETNGITNVNVSCDTIHFGTSKKGECKKTNPPEPESVFKRVQSSNPGHLLNMLGNVQEWTSTPDPVNPQKRFIKGGSYKSDRAEISIGASKTVPANNGAPDLGFRCVR